MKCFNQILQIALREMKILRKNPIYGFCMVVFPLLAMFFFTSMLDAGLPQDLPVGVVDLDNTTTTRALTRKLDGMQNSQVVAHFQSVAEARHAKSKIGRASCRERV